MTANERRLFMALSSLIGAVIVHNKEMHSPNAQDSLLVVTVDLAIELVRELKPLYEGGGRGT